MRPDNCNHHCSITKMGNLYEIELREARGARIPAGGRRKTRRGEATTRLKLPLRATCHAAAQIPPLSGLWN